MVYIFINLCKFTADVFLLAGIHRVTTCLISQRLEKPLKWIYIGEFLIIMIVITALYYIGSYFADEVLWLNVADPDIIDDVSSRKDKFEAAFFILQWVLTLFIFIIITVALFTEDGETISSVCTALSSHGLGLTLHSRDPTPSWQLPFSGSAHLPSSLSLSTTTCCNILP